jgi:hypothetical protein
LYLALSLIIAVEVFLVTKRPREQQDSSDCYSLAQRRAEIFNAAQYFLCITNARFDIPTDDAVFQDTVELLARNSSRSVYDANFAQRFLLSHFCVSTSKAGNWTRQPTTNRSDAQVQVQPAHNLNDDHECD